MDVCLSVVAGGYLDLRFVTTYRGAGRRLNYNRTSVSNGATALVQAGGLFVATGYVHMTNTTR